MNDLQSEPVLGTKLLNFFFFSLSAWFCEAVQTGGSVDPTGRLQMAEETLSKPAPDLQRLLQTAWHHRWVFDEREPVDLTHVFIQTTAAKYNENLKTTLKQKLAKC